MTPDTSPPTLLDELAGMTGLAGIIASGVVARACKKAGVAPGTLTRRDLPRVVEAIEPLLVVYLGPNEAARRAAQLRRFAESG